MRLTLRTLLAYLDDSLEAPEAEELGRKIDESEFARALVHRMRSATRRLRLGAPKLSGKGMGLDPNTVAEYLDYTLAPDRVQDFEKVCLESDVHLAEVAACHQILTNVLAGVADVDHDLREQIIGLQDPEIRTARSTPSIATHSSPADRPFDDEPAEVESLESNPAQPLDTDDFSAGTKKLNWPAVAIVATILLALGVLVMGPLDHRHPLLGRFLAQSPSANQSPSAKTAHDRTDSRSRGNIGAPGESPTGQAAGGHVAANRETPVSDQPPPKPDEQLDDRSSLDGPPRTSKPNPASPVEANADHAATLLPANDEAPSAPKPREADQRSTTDKSPLEQLEQLAAQPEETPPEKPAANETSPRKPKLTLPPSRAVAKLTSSNQVLARLEQQEETYFRIPSLATLDAGDQLFAPPLARPQLLLQGESGLQLTIVGPARLQLPLEPNQQPYRFDLKTGRTIWIRHTDQPATWEIVFAGRVYRITMRAPATTLAVSLHHATPPGEDPAAAKAWRAIEITATDGPIEVAPDQGKPIVIDPQQSLWRVNDMTPVVKNLGNLPNWLTTDATSQLDRAATQEIETQLALGRPLLLALHELTSHRRVEVRSLAVESLAAAGEFWPLVDSLTDRKLKAYWDRELAAASQAIRDDPRIAAELSAILEQRRGEEGKALYRILWGYSNEQLEEGADRELVTYLEHESLDLRAAAFWQLQQITGTTFLYRPDRTPKTQRSAIHKWRTAASEGKIRHRNSPLPPWLTSLLHAKSPTPPQED